MWRNFLNFFSFIWLYWRWWKLGKCFEIYSCSFLCCFMYTFYVFSYTLRAIPSYDDLAMHDGMSRHGTAARVYESRPDAGPVWVGWCFVRFCRIFQIQKTLFPWSICLPCHLNHLGVLCDINDNSTVFSASNVRVVIRFYGWPSGIWKFPFFLSFGFFHNNRLIHNNSGRRRGTRRAQQWPPHLNGAIIAGRDVMRFAV